MTKQKSLQASESASIPLIINPALIGTDSTSQVRDIKKGEVYVYDLKEDRNYLILNYLPATATNEQLPLMWVSGFKTLGLRS